MKEHTIGGVVVDFDKWRAWELSSLVRLAVLRVSTRRMRERTGTKDHSPVPEIMAKIPGGSWNA